MLHVSDQMPLPRLKFTQVMVSGQRNTRHSKYSVYIAEGTALRNPPLLLMLRLQAEMLLMRITEATINSIRSLVS